MAEERLMKDADLIALTGGGITALHSHPGGGGGGLVDKAGVVTTDGSGEAVVTFNTDYGDLNYFIQLTGAEDSDAINPTMKTGSKTVSGFTIHAFEDKGLSEPNVDVYWSTGPYSNP